MPVEQPNEMGRLPAVMAIRVSPIDASDLPAVAAFLHQHLNERVSAAQWQRSIVPPWKVDAPNHGFQLRDTDSGAVVGVYLAFYIEREVAGQPERFCNLGAWCVLPTHRFHAIKLLKALLAQDGYTFTDLSPSGTVVPINTKLKFDFLDTTTALLPNLPWPLARGRITADPAVLDATLTGRDLTLYRDHAGTRAARHLLLRDGDETCYVVFRKDRRKNLPLFASILYVSNPDLFHRMGAAVSRHLLLRHRVLATLVELRVAGRRPPRSKLLGSARRKMYRSARLRPEQIDYLYSELVCVAW